MGPWAWAASRFKMRSTSQELPSLFLNRRAISAAQSGRSESRNNADQVQQFRQGQSCGEFIVLAPAQVPNVKGVP